MESREEFLARRHAAECAAFQEAYRRHCEDVRRVLVAGEVETEAPDVFDLLPEAQEESH